MTGAYFKVSVWDYVLDIHLNEKALTPNDPPDEVYLEFSQTIQERAGRRYIRLRTLRTDKAAEVEVFIKEVKDWLLGVAYAIEMAVET